MFLLFSGRASGLQWSSSHSDPYIPVPSEDTPLNSLQVSYFCFLKYTSYSRCGSYIIDFIFPFVSIFINYSIFCSCLSLSNLL